MCPRRRRRTDQPALWQDAMGETTAAAAQQHNHHLPPQPPPDGRSWCQAPTHGAANNNSGIDLDRDDAGNLYLGLLPRVG